MYETHMGLTANEIKAYLRKSRSDDALLTVEEVLAKHEAMLDEWAEKNIGEKIADENKYREVVSGETIDDRPEMLKLLKDIESPRVKAILVVEVQRLSRGDLEDAGRLIKLLRYTNTLVITQQRTYDLRDEDDRYRFKLELERGNENLEYFKRIQKRGRELSVQSGNFIGSVAPYGYDKTKVMDGKKECPTLKINEAEATVVRMIFDLYVNKSMGETKIARHLDELKIQPPKGDFWSPPSIKEMLKNIHYIGKVKWNWRKVVQIVEDGEVVKTRPKSNIDEFLIFDGKHDAIITEEMFNAALARSGKSPRVQYFNTLKNPFAGILFCDCGHAMSHRADKQKGKEKQPRLLCQNQVHCKTSSCYLQEMVDIVCETLENAISDFEIRIKNDNSDSIKLHADLIKQLEKRQEDLNKKELNMWDKYTEEGMPQAVFEKMRAQITQEKEEVHEALCKAKNATPENIDYSEKLLRFSNALGALKDTTATVELQNTLLKQCIERITYTRKQTERHANGAARGGWYRHPIHVDIQLKV